MSKTIVIGDIHGCLRELQQLVESQPLDTQFYSVGDLIDRGPDTRGVIDYVRSHPCIQTVLGNHCQMAIECLPALRDYIQTPKQLTPYELHESNWFYNGGHDVFNQYKADDALEQLLVDIEWLATLPLIHLTGVVDPATNLELLVSHTWTSRYYGQPIQQTVLDFEMVWNRDQPLGKANASKYYNMFGHTPTDYILGADAPIPAEPLFYDGACNLDTGACYSTPTRGYLTAVSYPDLAVHQIKVNHADNSNQ